MKNLEEIPPDSTFKQFCSLRMRQAWLTNTQMKFQLDISQLTQVTEKSFDNEKKTIIRCLNKASKYVIDNKIVLRILRLEKDSLSIIDFADSSFATAMTSPHSLVILFTL